MPTFLIRVQAHIAQLGEATGVWRNGSASDSRSEGWEFESLCPHISKVKNAVSSVGGVLVNISLARVLSATLTFILCQMHLMEEKFQAVFEMFGRYKYRSPKAWGIRMGESQDLHCGLLPRNDPAVHSFEFTPRTSEPVPRHTHNRTLSHALIRLSNHPRPPACSPSHSSARLLNYSAAYHSTNTCDT